MLRCLLLLAVAWKLAKVRRAHVKSCERHVFFQDGGGEGEVSRGEALSDCCCVC